MYRILIVYATKNSIIEETANRIKSALPEKDFHINLKSATEAIMPDIAASDLIFFGSDGKDKAFIHPDFEEIKRSLQGINLAGRHSALFAQEENTLKAWRTALKDSGITIQKESLTIHEGLTPKEVSAWTQEVLKTFKEGQNE